MRVASSRKGVASVLGTVFFVLVFMVALGSLAYAAGVQEQAAGAQLSAGETVSRRGAESLVYSSAASGLTATNSGPATLMLNHLVLKYPNGTAYLLSASAAVPAGGSLAVQSLVPAGVCSPGTATCLSRYRSILSGNPAGSTVGVVTSMGNSFWYSPASAGPLGDWAYFVQSTASTTSGTLTPVPGFSFTGVPGGTYIVNFQVGYYQSAGTSDLVYFGVTVPPDAILLACASVAASTNPSQSSCSSVSGTVLPQPGCYALSSNPVCSFQLTVFVSFGSSGGSLQLDFKSNGGVSAYVVVGSYLMASRLS